MKQLIKMSSLYSADLYTRSRASGLRSCIQADVTDITLDFEVICFMSRSFADEIPLLFLLYFTSIRDTRTNANHMTEEKKVTKDYTYSEPGKLIETLKDLL